MRLARARLAWTRSNPAPVAVPIVRRNGGFLATGKEILFFTGHKLTNEDLILHVVTYGGVTSTEIRFARSRNFRVARHIVPGTHRN